MITVSNTLFKIPIQISLAGIAISSLTYYFTKTEFKLNEFWWALIKFIAYGIIVGLIYKNSITKPNIDILTFLTYLVAFFEAMHNLSNSLLILIIFFIKYHI